jgi:GntR family transcriptional regulator
MPVERLTYRGIADDLAARIASGEYPRGSKLPSHSQLVGIYSSSLATIVRAVGLLHDRRLVQGVPGVGVFVADAETPKGP